jgi:TIR domain
VAHAIFISYRRDDSEGEAGRLFDDLTRAFGNENVFMDVAGILPGVDFRRAIENNVASCGVLLAIIGPNWVGITNTAGQRRLDDPNDFVVLEIASALKREVPVIPVLVHEAHMPTPDQLPETLKDFSYRNSVELSHGRWNSDVQLLIQALASYVTPNPADAQEPVHAAIPVQLPAPHPGPAGSKPVTKKKKLRLILGIVGAVFLAFLALIYFMGGSGTPDTAPPSASGSGTTAASGGPASLIGAWKDPNPRSKKDGNNLASLTISGSGSSLSMQGFGLCQPPPCDWGTQAAQFDGTNATATFNPTTAPDTTRAATVSVHLTGANLDVTIQNTFNGPSGSWQNQVHRIFIPGP